jgi:protein-S-isoprenylcysteine O-methyltransferase Ste14
MWAGIGLRQWSIHVLARYFTYEVTIQEGQQVVSSGPYRVVRHPSYSGLLLTEAGVGLTLGSLLSLLIAVLVPLIGILSRIRVEEAALRTGLGSAYERYAQGRSRLEPGVW